MIDSFSITFVASCTALLCIITIYYCNNNNNNNNNNATLLGAPLFPGSILDKTWSDRCDELAVALDRLATLGSQNALILLRSSLSAPKVLHLLRCSPSVSNPFLERFDTLLRSAIQRITNSDRLTDVQWLQAGLHASTKT